MASYRFSASVISRSAGRSAVAAAAYRSGARLEDARYGESHDYTRKGGVLHSEIMAPDRTPSWMLDREALWNAVEAAENRKDAQLSREVQLSLPHELSDAERLALVRGFVAEQFVGRGMIADVAIHAPHRQGDDRNHHAHVMLTLRELTGEGFGKKAREWNDRANVDHWRDAWAQHQNRAFERLGIEMRVDHRSLSAQGIDREPEQHEGPNVTAMRRKDKPSRVADENDRRREANGARADLHAELLKLRQEIDRQRARFDQWARRRAETLEAAQGAARSDQDAQHVRDRSALDRRLAVQYGENLRTVAAEARATEERLQQGGLRRVLRKIAGIEKADRQRLERLQGAIRTTKERIVQTKASLARQQAAEEARLRDAQTHRQVEQREALERARIRKEETLQGRHEEWWRRQVSPDQDNNTIKEQWWRAQGRNGDERSAEPPSHDKKRDRGHEPER